MVLRDYQNKLIGENMKHFAIAIAMVLAAMILGYSYYNSKKVENTVRVVGYASGEYDSDIMKWNVSISTNQPTMLEGFQVMHADLLNFRQYIAEHNIDATNISVRPMWNYANYNREGNLIDYRFEQNFSVTIREVDRFDEIEELANDLTQLLKSGISIKNSSVEYYLSALPELKIEIISNATSDARDRALQVAKTTKTKLGKLKSGRVGVFQITEPLSVEVQSYGIFNTNTRRKQISVTFTGEFQLR
jgi:hypothetical protein